MKITDKEKFRYQLLEHYTRDIDGLNDKELIAYIVPNCELSINIKK